MVPHVPEVPRSVGGRVVRALEDRNCPLLCADCWDNGVVRRRAWPGSRPIQDGGVCWACDRRMIAGKLYVISEGN